MRKRYSFTTHLESPSVLPGEVMEFDVFVVFTYDPGRPAKMYLPNGDPGYPAEPAEVDILSVWCQYAVLGGDMVAEGTLSEADRQTITERAFEHVEGIGAGV